MGKNKDQIRYDGKMDFEFGEETASFSREVAAKNNRYLELEMPAKKITNKTVK
ncbi:hypothetical protein Q428_00480 [Fervidicella metallireducens AeB]|uniref:Uncharacterized protein n=1 Tax=Fervidicella metallireducens AeB TaxID=1403537 RepID=A0A017RYW9_9CLOT|nr:hypothetical protein [Fervidicella metallireducens]EYE89877.1 hypothetical protein Q428_00480 [Fervidicella metallireducens AeB]